MFKENQSLKLLHYFVYAYSLSIIFLSFYTDAPVPFFSSPNYIFFGVLLFINTLIFFWNISERKKFLLRLPFFVLLPYYFFLVAYATKMLFSIEVNSLILIGFFPTLCFYFLLSNFKNNVIDWSVLFAKVVIVSGLLVSMLELYQIYFLDFENFQLYNQSKDHYARLIRHGGIFTNRLYGLTGNFTINGVIYVLCAQYLIYYDSLKHKKIRGQKENIIYLLMVVLGVLLSRSGTGYFLLALFIVIHAFKAYRFVYQLILFPIVIFLIMLIGNIFEIGKINSEYFFHNIDILFHYFLYLANYNFIDIFFGFLPAGRIDTFFTFLISEVGVFGLVTFILFYCKIYLDSNSQGKIFVLLLFLASFRYPAMANQIIQLLIAFYFYSLYGKKKINNNL